MFAWYIQSQHIYSNKTYSSNFWQHISNTKVILQKRTIPNSVPEGHKETLSIYNHPPSVGIIYPIATYIFHSHIFPKLLAAYIQYKGYSSKTYITQLCARRAQRNPFNLQSSPKCCLVLSNRNIYIPCTHTPQIVRTTYLIEMSYTQLCARRAQRNPFNLQSSQGTPKYDNFALFVKSMSQIMYPKIDNIFRKQIRVQLVPFSLPIQLRIVHFVLYKY